MAGVPIGKRDYMMHLVPLIKKEMKPNNPAGADC
jgi:hypothetical protein